MKSAGMLFEDDRRVSILGGAGQPKSIDAGSFVHDMQSSTQRGRHRGATSSTCASPQANVRQSNHAIIAASSAGVGEHAQAPA